MHIISLYSWFFMIFMLLVSASCTAVRDAHIPQQMVSSNCNQQNIYRYTEDDMPQPLHTLHIDENLIAPFSHENLNMVNAIGILDDIKVYVGLKDDPDSADLEKRLRTLELKQGIDHKINMASLEVSAIASEMDCEEERTDQVANYLHGGERNLEPRLTVAAIVVGATGAIATGGCYSK